MSADLITLDRAKLAFPGLIGSTQDLAIGGYVTTASRATEKYCKRIFSIRTYDEVYDTDGTGTLMLRKFPVISVSRLASTLSQVLYITQTDRTSNTRATVATQQPDQFDVPTPTIGLTLTRVTGGLPVVDDSILWSDHPTIASVAAAVNALGHGWQASAATGYQFWASSDITPIAGAQSCLGGGASLYVHATDLSGWQLVPDIGEVRFSTGVAGVFGSGWTPGDTYGVGFEPGTNLPRGGRNIRIVYQAGFRVIPEDVQQGVALWCSHMFQEAQNAGEFTSETLGDHSIGRQIDQGPPKHVRTYLDQYKDYRV